ncbi:MAG: hypothetical protein JNL39_09265 [Opitutaceae bacterium]|nr:hypothetical protein [Opitutaceae bacterium]
MNKNIILAVPFGLLAAALVLFFAGSLPVEAIVGFAAVLVVLRIAALEYRITWRSLFGRS